jgi:hypothetical protein
MRVFLVSAATVCVTAAPASPEFVCNLGSNVTWAKGDAVTVTVPVVVAAGTPTGTLVNTANVVDEKNNTAEDTTTTNVCAECVQPTVRCRFYFFALLCYRFRSNSNSLAFAVDAACQQLCGYHALHMLWQHHACVITNSAG